MIEFIPYFAGFITLMFGVSFSYAITDGWNLKSDKRKVSQVSDKKFSFTEKNLHKEDVNKVVQTSKELRNYLTEVSRFDLNKLNKKFGPKKPSNKNK